MCRVSKAICCFVLALALIAPCLMIPFDTARAAGAIDPPHITGVRVVNPNVQKPGIVYLDIDFTENGIGVDNICLVFYSESRQILNYGWHSIFPVGNSAYSGTIREAVPVPTNTREETYVMEGIYIVDRAGNTTSYYLSDGFLQGEDNTSFPAPSFNVTDEFDVEMEIALSNPQLVSKLQGLSEGKTAKLLIDNWSNDTLPKAALDAIRGSDKTLVLYKDALQWVINGRNIIKPSKDIKLNVALEPVDGSEFGVSEQLYSAQFHPNGELPGKATIRLKSDYLYNLQGITGTLYLYHETEDGLEEEEGNFNLVLNGEDKWCYFDVTHNSRFIISGQKIKPTYAVKSVSLNKSQLELNIGGSEVLLPTILPANATNKKVTWTSGDQAVATVDANGKVKGVAPGTAIITVTTEDGKKTAKCTVKVLPTAVKSVSLDRKELELKIGESVALKETVLPANATNKKVTWTSGNQAVATVDANGKVKGLASGTTTITVITEDGKRTAKCTVTVLSAAVQRVKSVSLNKKQLKIYTGKSATLKATVSPDNATNKKVSWKSSNTKIATVKNGVVTGVKPGAAVITVTTADGKKTAQCTVTVMARVTSVSVSRTAVYLKKGATTTLKAVPVTVDGASAKLHWESSAPKTVSVTSKGKIKALKAGKATITATADNGKSARIVVNVGGKTPKSVKVTNLPKKNTMKIGDTLKLKFAVNPKNAQGILTFKTSAKDIVSVDAAGRLTAHKKGTATITVSLGKKSARFKIKVIK